MLGEPDGVRELLEAVVAAFSILGGTMAYLSGLWAAQALVQREASAVIAERINEGIGVGFIWGGPAATVTFTILV